MASVVVDVAQDRPNSQPVRVVLAVDVLPQSVHHVRAGLQLQPRRLLLQHLGGGLKIQKYRDTVIQKYGNTEIQRYRGKKYRITEYRKTKIQKYSTSRLNWK